MSLVNCPVYQNHNQPEGAKPTVRKIEFTPDQIKQLRDESIHHKHHIVRRRMLALWLKAHGEPHQDIAERLGISGTTLRDYFDLYLAGGLDALKTLHYRGKANQLAEHKEAIMAALEANPPATYKEAQATIKAVTGLHRSLPQVRAFLKKNKLKRRKVKQIPAKADVVAQESFKTETLEPLVEQAHHGQLHLFFVDAAHFVMLPFLGYLYSLTVRYVKSTSGRKRFNVLGALHAVSHELVTLCNHTYINAEAVCELLEKLHQLYRDLPLVVVLDNARYQKCQRVLDTAQRLQIQLIFLPPYSPNLNLIERLWKFVKKEVLYNNYYQHYDQFCAAIADCLAQTHTTHQAALETLLTPKFQSFTNVTFNP